MYVVGTMQNRLNMQTELHTNNSLQNINVQVIDILHDTIVDGPSFRTSIYFAGCKHACKNCHNQSSWNFDAGHSMSLQELFDICMSDDFADVTLTGGDPMYNAAKLVPLTEALRNAGKNVWLYTGFTIEQVLRHSDMSTLAYKCNVIVDGPYIDAMRNDALLFRGSSNQRLIDMSKTTVDSIVLYTDLHT